MKWFGTPGPAHVDVVAVAERLVWGLVVMDGDLRRPYGLMDEFYGCVFLKNFFQGAWKMMEYDGLPVLSAKGGCLMGAV